MPFENLTLSFIGAGMMGEAMIKGLLNKQLIRPEQIIAADPYEERGRQLVERYGLRYTSDNGEAAQEADLLVLSVKPQVLDSVMPVVRRGAHSAMLVLSIIAGAKIRTIADGVANASVVRAMPNTPAQIGQGITVWTATPEVLEPQRKQAETLLSALGEQIYLDDERYLDMATALSGTGPAYIFLFMEALIDAGVHMGFSRRDAERLVLQTMRGSVEYAAESGLHPAQLRNQVTSPGGTSAEAIYHLEKGGLRTVISRAVWAAYQRSVTLGSGASVQKPDNGE
ncbi:MAG: pyrroline-5-carboxylate reductase [Anaerolineaceae bacterium]|nr:pyrroline-5-carboxylate reductase [Anaerolineaceae bacterium]